MDETKKRDREDLWVTGLFHDRTDAEMAYSSVLERGYTKDDVTVMMSDDTRKTRFINDPEEKDTKLGNKALEGTGAGSAIGGTAGAIVGALAAVGTSIALPGLGLVVAGPIAGALAGAGAGGATGGLVGALIGSGIPEERADVYHKAIKDGGILMGVQARNEEEAKVIEETWRKNHGEHVYH